MDPESLQLSPEEWAVFQDRDFLPLKQQVWAKLEGRLALLHQALWAEVSQDAHLPAVVRQGRGKRSRGENYQAFPYRVLDCPSVLEKEDWFLFRALIMWGHSLSFHFILKGRFQASFAPTLWEKRHQLSSGWMLHLGEDPWRWIQGEEKEVSLAQMEASHETAPLLSRPHIKLSRYLPLNSYAKLGQQGLKSWQEIRSVLGSQA
ncbi:MAG: hypothetical protein AAFR61_02205 [Bacteroidota bacterium]